MNNPITNQRVAALFNGPKFHQRLAWLPSPFPGKTFPVGVIRSYSGHWVTLSKAPFTLGVRFKSRLNFIYFIFFVVRVFFLLLILFWLVCWLCCRVGTVIFFIVRQVFLQLLRSLSLLCSGFLLEALNLGVSHTLGFWRVSAIGLTRLRWVLSL